MDGSTVNTIFGTVPASAWMVPLVPNVDAKPALEYRETEEVWEVCGVKVHVSVATLVPCDQTGGIATVTKLADGEHYAVLKRGLLSLNCIDLFYSYSFPSWMRVRVRI